MSLADEFRTAVTQAYEQQVALAELMPMVLAQACVKVLPIDGAGLSMTEDLRVPLGASDEVVARAERLQTTLGEGPCLAATITTEPLVVDLATMASRWPMFHREVLVRTPFRSIASLPLRSPHRKQVGALDLYSTDPDAAPFGSINEVNIDIAGPIAAILFEAPSGTNTRGVTLPTWLDTDSVTDRMNVWVAIGMLIERADLSNTDALALLRGYAFSNGSTLEDLATQITTRQLSLATLLD